MAKRGRKSYSESESQRQKLYEAYKRQYRTLYNKYGGNLSAELNKDQFDAMYKTYRDLGINQNVIRSMVKDQQNVTGDQARAWLKLAKKKKMDIKLRDFLSGNTKSEAFWNYVDDHGGFRQALYVDDDSTEDAA